MQVCQYEIEIKSGIGKNFNETSILFNDVSFNRYRVQINEFVSIYKIKNAHFTFHSHIIIMYINALSREGEGRVINGFEGISLLDFIFPLTFLGPALYKEVGQPM